MIKRQSYEDLKQITFALNEAFIGARLQKVRDPDPYTISLKLRIPQFTYFLTLSAHPILPRVELSLTQPSTLPEPTGVGRWTRSHLEGRRIKRFDLLDNDRVLAMVTEEGALYLELIPRAPNLYAIDPSGAVQTWLRKLAQRGLSLGQTWIPPTRPPHTAADGESAQHTQSSDDHRPEEVRWLDLSSITPGDAPSSTVDLNAPPHERSPVLSVLLERSESARQTIEATERAADAQATRQLLKQTQKRLTRLSEALWSDMEKGDQAEEWKRRGELLKSHLHLMERGMTTVEVTDWFDPELGKINLPLEPTLDGPENVERLFHKHRKALRGAALAEERLAEVERQREELKGLVEDYAEGPLSALKAELQLLGVYRERQRPQERRGKKKERLPYRVFWSLRGEAIWLGRGGLDNHETTFRRARGRDHWIHTRDVPGAHVIVPLTTRDHEPHFETLLDATALAIHHSEQRGEEGVAVYHTSRKHIRPVPNGPPGKVMVSASQTLTGIDVDVRIKRLYDEVTRRQSLASGSE